MNRSNWCGALGLVLALCPGALAAQGAQPSPATSTVANPIPAVPRVEAPPSPPAASSDPVATPHSPPAGQTVAPSATSSTALAVAGSQATTPADIERYFAEVVNQPGGLTSAQAATRAAKTSTQAQVKVEEIRSAEATIDQTLWSSAPRLTLSARYTRLSPITNGSFGPSGSGGLVATTAGPGLLPQNAPLIGIDPASLRFPVLLNNTTLNANVVIPLSDYLFSTVHAVRGAKAARETVLLDERAARVRSAAEAKLAYYSWTQAKLQEVLVAQTLAQARVRRDTTERLFAAGRAAQADVLQADAYVADNELMVQRARTATLVAEEKLRIAMHAEPGEPLAVGENVLAEDTRPLDTDREALFREGVQQRLEIQSLAKTDYAFSQAVDVQEAGAYPRVEAFGNVTYSNPNQRVFPQENEFRATWDVGVQAVWTLNDLGTSRANARKSAAQRAQLLSQKHMIEDALRLEIMSATQAMVESQQAVATAQQAEKAAEAAYQARELLYRHGRATNLEVIQAETSRFQAKLSLINARVGLHIARVQLEHALGRDNHFGQ